MSGQSLDAWCKNGEYLPAFMRDFHDQKDVFKVIHEIVERRNAKDPTGYTKDLSWIAAHVYTVDFFLWFMARHGYTLQRSRKRVPFFDLDERIETDRTKQQAATARVLGFTPVGPATPTEGEGGAS